MDFSLADVFLNCLFRCLISFYEKIKFPNYNYDSVGMCFVICSIPAVAKLNFVFNCKNAIVFN